VRAHEILNELFDPKTGFELEWDDSFGPKEIHATAYDKQGRSIDINFVPVDPEYDAVDIEFTRGGSYDVTGKGDAEAVLSTVLTAIRTYLQKYHKPAIILFSGKELSRQKLYQSMIARFAAPFGYSVALPSNFPQLIQNIPGLDPTGTFILIKQQK
jgi:hypothetical protein